MSDEGTNRDTYSTDLQTKRAGTPEILNFWDNPASKAWIRQISHDLLKNSDFGITNYYDCKIHLFPNTWSVQKS